MEIRILSGAQDRTHAARLAYDIYVKECGILADLADHTAGVLRADNAQHTQLIGAFADATLVGVIGVHCWADARFPDLYADGFAIARFAEVVPPQQMAYVTRLLVHPDWRCRTVTFRLLEQAWRYMNARGIQLIFGDCQPHLLRLYRGLGMRPFGHLFNYAGSGVAIPLVGVPADHDYLRRIKALTLAWLPPESENPQLAARLGQLVAASTPVVTAQSHPTAYWDAIERVRHVNVTNSINALANVSSDRLARVLANSFILDCKRGDQLTERGQTIHSAYTVLEGELEVQCDRRRRRIGPGALCGEFQRRGPGKYDADTFVAAKTARVLVLDAKAMLSLRRSSERSTMRPPLASTLRAAS